MEKIIINKAKCKKCGDIIESKEINDFKRVGNKNNIVELLKFDNMVTKEVTNESK